MKEYRKRIKNSAEKKEKVLEKDRKRKQAERSKEKDHGVSTEVKAHRDKLNRERVSKFRSKKKSNPEKEGEPLVYKSRRSLGKAVSRAVKSLPLSPRKKKVIIKQLAEKEGLIKSSAKPRNVTSEETAKKVEEFYCRDDMSRQAPGRKDYVTLWTKEGKVRLQKRHNFM